MLNQERAHRLRLWQTLLHQGGPSATAPHILRELGIYGGAQGIWIDKGRTRQLTPDGTGVTIGLLHTGSAYPDDLSATGVLYHYPTTNRPALRDQNEIAATKAAGRLSLPVFVITYPSRNARTRDVHLGWIEGWDDDTGIFLIQFADSPPETLLTNPDQDYPFELVQQHRDREAMTAIRPHQQRFRFQVFQRYGAACAVCDLGIPQLLDAVHIMPRNLGGTDDPRNGLVLCALHHRAFDAGFFGIEPTSLKICVDPSGPDRHALRLTREDISHLQRLPHINALEWLWQNSDVRR